MTDSKLSIRYTRSGPRIWIEGFDPDLYRACSDTPGVDSDLRVSPETDSADLAKLWSYERNRWIGSSPPEDHERIPVVRPAFLRITNMDGSPYYTPGYPVATINGNTVRVLGNWRISNPHGAQYLTIRHTENGVEIWGVYDNQAGWQELNIRNTYAVRGAPVSTNQEEL